MEKPITYTMKLRSTVTTSGNGTPIVLPGCPKAATFFLNIATASGTLKVGVQRGISTPIATNSEGLPVAPGADDTVEWFDWLMLTSTTTTGKQVRGVTIYTSSGSASYDLTTSGNAASNFWLGPPFGDRIRAVHQPSGVGPSFVYELVGQFEF